MKTKVMTIIAGLSLVVMASCGGGGEEGGEGEDGKKGTAKYGLGEIKQEGAIKEAYPGIEAMVVALNTGNYEKAYAFMQEGKQNYMKMFNLVAKEYAGDYKLPEITVSECKVNGEGEDHQVECKLKVAGDNRGRRLLFVKEDGKWKESFMGLSLGSMTIKGANGEFEMAGYSFDNLGGEGYADILIDGQEVKVLVAKDDAGEMIIVGEEFPEDETEETEEDGT